MDLNRNYDWDFNDDLGSSTDPCSDSYRGPFPFSEPETQAMKNFIGTHASTVKLAFNLHSYGNLLVQPFSNTPKPELRTLYPVEYEIYREVWVDGQFPEGNV